MDDERRYTIGELAEAAQTTPRTIRYYSAEGLLPPPLFRGKYTLYTTDHLQRLQLIARLKESYLPLTEIRARIAPLTSQEIAAALRESVSAPLSSASDYIRETAERYNVPAAVPAPPAAPPAAHRKPPLHFPPAPAPGAPPHPPPTLYPHQGEQWARHSLAPGVELHVREPQSSLMHERIRQLLDLARRLLTW